jgi:pSer/pThr/pTyr-binding forkhead associated (FHA) protein
MAGVSANPPADAQSVSELKARAEAERAGRPFLLYRDGDGRQQLLFLQPGSAHPTVGRRAPSDLVLDWDDQVSRLHARFEWVQEDWVLVDEGLSRNGTFVNEERLSGRCRLNDGDALRFGTTTITFRSPGRAQPGAGAAAETPDGVSLSTTQRRVLAALCRPYEGSSRFATPATDQQIAEELFLSVGAVKTHLSVLYAKLGVEELPQSETRVRLVEQAFSAGLISDRDL